jgi:hypothetical protein
VQSEDLHFWNVREYAEGFPVELAINESGRLVVRAYNEAGHNGVELDLYDLLQAISYGEIPNEYGASIPVRLSLDRDREGP